MTGNHKSPDLMGKVADNPSNQTSTSESYPHVPSRLATPVGGSCQQNNMELLWAAVRPIPMSNNIGARVEHFYLHDATGSATDIIAQHLHLPHDFIHRLVWFGSIYWSPVVPAPPASSCVWIAPEMQERILSWRAAGIAKHGKDVSLELSSGVDTDH